MGCPFQQSPTQMSRQLATRSASSLARSFFRLIIRSMWAMMSLNHSLKKSNQSVHKALMAYNRVASQVRAIVGISENAWNIAQEKLGPAIASASIALIFDKYNDNEIKSPGGYLRAMVERAFKGELHLDRSFYGRLSQMKEMG